MTNGEARQSRFLGLLAVVIASSSALALFTSSSLAVTWLMLGLSVLIVLFILWRKKTGLTPGDEIDDEKVRAWQVFICACIALYFLAMFAVGVLLLKNGVTTPIKIASASLLLGLYVLATAARLAIRSRSED